MFSFEPTQENCNNHPRYRKKDNQQAQQANMHKSKQNACTAASEPKFNFQNYSSFPQLEFYVASVRVALDHITYMNFVADDFIKLNCIRA
jgi:hypothetical protein